VAEAEAEAKFRRKAALPSKKFASSHSLLIACNSKESPSKTLQLKPKPQKIISKTSAKIWSCQKFSLTLQRKTRKAGNKNSKELESCLGKPRP
jgi:hypothetical protein